MDKKNFSEGVGQFLVRVLLVVLIVVGFNLFYFLKSRAVAVVPARSIVVSAEGKAVVSPDIAKISFSAVTEGKDPAVLQKENTKKMNDAIAYLKSRGIEAKDIKTSQYNLSPRYDYRASDGGRPVLSGYVLTQSVLVKVRKLEQAGEVLAGLTPLGINEINSLQFDIDDPEIFIQEARAQAFAKARAKAKEMARENGVRLGKVITFTESQGGYPRPYYDLKAGAISQESLPPVPTLEAGTQEVTVQVSATYELR